MRAMKMLATFAVALSLLIPAILGLPLENKDVIERPKRQGQSYWSCDEWVNGCNITFGCTAIPDLDLDRLVCHLNGRKFNCISQRPPHLPGPYKLYFWIDANLATVNTASNHRMVISVRGSVDGNTVSLPWIFSFRGDPYSCPANAEPPTAPTGGGTTTVARVTTTMTPVARPTSAVVASTTNIVRPTTTTTMTIAGARTTVTQHITTTMVPTSTSVHIQTTTRVPRPMTSTSQPAPTTTATITQSSTPQPSATPDPIMVDMAIGKDVVDAVLARLNSSGWETHANALQFLRRIAIAESNFGNDSDTFDPGNYGGIWQVDEEKFITTKDLAQFPQLASEIVQVINLLRINWLNGITWSDLRKPLYSAIAACLYLSTIPEPIPLPLEEQAQYWKQHYHKNGTATVADFIDRVNEMEGNGTPTPSPVPPPICNAGRNQESNNLVIFCASQRTIIMITCEVNGRSVPCRYESGTITIEDDILIEGRNFIELTIYYDDSLPFTYTMTYEVDGTTTTPAPAVARVECTARFIQNSGLEITCVINNDFNGTGITSITYSVNNQTNQRANSIPKFIIPIDKLRNGPNTVTVEITHTVYGAATVPLDVYLDIQPPQPPCKVSCSYRGIVGAVQFECRVSEGNGNLSSVGYAVNNFAASNLPVIFQIPISNLAVGDNAIVLTFVVVCNGQLETLQYEVTIPVSPPSQSNFRVSNVRASTTTFGLSGLRISYTVRRDVLSISVTIGGEVVSSYNYTVNSGSNQSTTDSEVSMHKDSLVEGQNTLQLAVYYRRGSAVANFNITFIVQK